MSQSYSSSKSHKVSGDPSEGEKPKNAGKSSDKTEFESNNPDKCLREKVLKEVGLTSTAFIGPAFPPQAPSAKSDIEDSLSMFYKELEKIDTPNEHRDNPEKDVQPNHSLREPPTSKDSQDVPDGERISVQSYAEKNGNQSNSGTTTSCWAHWDQNEPYQLKNQRRAGNEWDYTHPQNGPPYPRFQRPQFPHQSHHSAYSPPQNTREPFEINPNQHQNSYYPTFSSFRPSNASAPPSHSFHENLQQHFDWNEPCFYETNSNDVAVRWPEDQREGLAHGNDYGRPQRFLSENKPWEQPGRYHSNEERCEYRYGLVLILMRGLPGSGKTTLARELLSSGPSGIILSTDDYFAEKEGYRYDPGLLGAAHEWNQNRAKDALHDGRSPIIIDNTNLQAWEMKPYVEMALERGYRVDFCEPDTRWKFDPYELEKRNKHGVPQEKIAQMMDRFSSPISIDIVMSSQEPAHVNQRRRPEQPHIRKKMRYC